MSPGTQLRTLLLLSAGLCSAQDDLCRVTKRSPAVDAQIALNKIISRYGFNGRVLLYESSDKLVTDRGGSAAALCQPNQAEEEWIVYSPAFLNGKSEMARFFVLAHELAHHVRKHTSPTSEITGREAETDADYWAAVYLSGLRYLDKQILGGFDELPFPAAATLDHPGRAERRDAVAKGYAFDHKDDPPVEVPPKAQPPVTTTFCTGKPAAQAWYTNRAIAGGTAIQQDNVTSCGTAVQPADVPTEFARDLAGMCAAAVLPAGMQLSWSNIDVCTLGGK